jgi:hypothetical protein
VTSSSIIGIIETSGILSYWMVIMAGCSCCLIVVSTLLPKDMYVLSFNSSSYPFAGLLTESGTIYSSISSSYFELVCSSIALG